MAVSLAAPQKDLPVLFQFQQPTHNVAVFRGADLKNAIAAGLVKGFPGASGSAGAVATKQVVTPVVPAPVVRVAHPVAHPVVHPVGQAVQVAIPAPEEYVPCAQRLQRREAVTIAVLPFLA